MVLKVQRLGRSELILYLENYSSGRILRPRCRNQMLSSLFLPQGFTSRLITAKSTHSRLRRGFGTATNSWATVECFNPTGVMGATIKIRLKVNFNRALTTKKHHRTHERFLPPATAYTERECSGMIARMCVYVILSACYAGHHYIHMVLAHTDFPSFLPNNQTENELTCLVKNCEQ